MFEPRITYIVAVSNMARTIDRCLSSILSQKPYEVIVVDAHSTDGTTETISKYPVKHSFDPGYGPSYARNLALTLATGDYVVAVDGDQWLPSNFKETLTNIVTKERSDVVRYREVVYCEGYWSRCYLMERLVSSFVLQALGLNFPTPFSPLDESNVRIIRRDCLIKVGGWDSRLISFEDTDLWLRLHCLPDLKVSKCNKNCPIIFSDESDLTPLTEFKRGVFYGRGILKFMEKHHKYIQAFLFFPLDLIFSHLLFITLFARTRSPRLAFGAFLLRAIRSLGYVTGVIKFKITTSKTLSTSLTLLNEMINSKKLCQSF